MLLHHNTPQFSRGCEYQEGRQPLSPANTLQAELPPSPELRGAQTPCPGVKGQPGAEGGQGLAWVH